MIRYALANRRMGTAGSPSQKVDADVAYMSPSTVYRILNDADLLHREARQEHRRTASAARSGRTSAGTRSMYLRVEGTWYFLVTVLDGYSR